MQVLAYQAGGTLVTGDTPDPVALSKMPADAMARFGDKMKPGLLLRFKVGEQGFFLGESGAVAGADLQWVGVANQMRGGGDQYSRIVFQWQLRNGRVTFDVLLRAVRGNAHAQPCEPLPMSSWGDLDGASMAT
jgi:hypothetical protein